MLHTIEMIDFVSFFSGLYPVAFAIVSEKNDSNWEYFFQYLKVAVGTSRNLTFVSDRQHGIIAGVKNVFPDAVHGFCYKHLTSNLKQSLGVHQRLSVRKFLKSLLIVPMLPLKMSSKNTLISLRHLVVRR